MSITFHRDVLFAEVWKTPLTTLAPRYGLSDNGLRKVCIALEIPLPKVGHWAKVAVGKAPPTPLLPTTEGRTTYESNQLSRVETRPPVTTEDEIWLAERVTEERDPGHKIYVESPTKNWHPAVLQLKLWLESCVAEYLRALKESERIENYNSKRDPQRQIANFEHYAIQANHPVLGHTHRACAMRVSFETYQRALAIFNSIALAAEDRGFSVELAEKRERLRITMASIDVEMYIVEESPDELVNGRLRLCVEKHRYSSVQINETENARLENALNRVFVYAYRCVVKGKAERSEKERNEREAVMRLQYMEEMERQHKFQVQLQIEEDNRRKEFVKQADNWEAAVRVKALIARMEVQVMKEGIASSAFQEWRSWALQVAESLDPMAVILMKLKTDDSK